MNEDLESTEYGRIISALVIGIGTALKEKTITLDKAEQYLFNPFTMDELEKVGVSKEVILLIHIGTELEDIVSLVPEHFDEALEEMIALAHDQMKSLPKTRLNSNPWFLVTYMPVTRKTRSRERYRRYSKLIPSRMSAKQRETSQRGAATNKRTNKSKPTDKVTLTMNENFEPIEYGRIISALVVGIGTALKEKTITLDEAEECLFHQDLVDVLEFAGIPKEVVGLIHVETELKDIETLVAGHVDGEESDDLSA